MAASRSSTNRLPTVRRGWRAWSAPSWLLAAGLLLWLAAQALPARHGSAPLGLEVTLGGWLLGLAGMLLFSNSGWWFFALLAWGANVLFLAELRARRRENVGRASGLAWATLLCAPMEIVSIVLDVSHVTPMDRALYGAVAPDLSTALTSVGTGTWVWIASLVLVSVSTWWWAHRRSRVRSGPAFGAHPT